MEIADSITLDVHYDQFDNLMDHIHYAVTEDIYFTIFSFIILIILSLIGALMMDSKHSVSLFLLFFTIAMIAGLFFVIDKDDVGHGHYSTEMKLLDVSRQESETISGKPISYRMEFEYEDRKVILVSSDEKQYQKTKGYTGETFIIRTPEKTIHEDDPKKIEITVPDDDILDHFKAVSFSQNGDIDMYHLEIQKKN